MPTPALPAPAHPEIDSMLSRKFGREVANYFSGSPLNRVGFLRSDSTFLSLALRHPSASFLLLNDLAPLVTKDKTRLAYVSHGDVRPVIGEDPYAVAEEEMIRTFNSGRHVPQMIFLGLEEGKDGVEYTPKKGTYKGKPYFAIDVTPRKSVKEAAEALIKTVGERGLVWAPGRAMDLKAEDGMYGLLLCYKQAANTYCQPPSSPKPANCSTGTSATPSAPNAANPLSLSMVASSVLAHPRTPQICHLAPLPPTPKPHPMIVPPAPPERASPTCRSPEPILRSSWPSSIAQALTFCSADPSGSRLTGTVHWQASVSQPRVSRRRYDVRCGKKLASIWAGWSCTRRSRGHILRT